MNGARYQSGSLRAIHDFKASYQRNMILANAVVAFLVVLSVALSSFVERGNGVQGAAVPPPSSSVRGQAIPPARMARSAGSGSCSPASGHLIGFGTKYRIVPDVAPPRRSIDIAASQTDLPAPIITHEASFALASGDGEAGYFVSDDHDFGPPPSGPYMPEVRYGDPLGLGQSEVRVFECRPARVWLTTPRWPLTANRSDTGLVQMLVIIDEDGCIEWEVLSEVPQGQGFASVVADALIHSRYKPAVVNGRKVKQPVRLSFVLCCECYPTLAFEGNVQASWR